MIFSWWNDRRRRRLRAAPVPESWGPLLPRLLPVWSRLCPEEQRRLRVRMQVFLGESSFEGCNGQEITEEIRVCVAAWASFLRLGHEPGHWEGLSTILVYPGAFVREGPRHLPDGTVLEAEEVLLGEAWDRGTVILSWEDVQADLRQRHAGRNVILHEFAHVLDGQDGGFDGAPPFSSRPELAEWAQVMGDSFKALRHAVERRRRPFIDAYGATDPAEFFAVATETFFLQPHRLERPHPALYQALQDFYNQDPAARLRRR